MDLTSCSGAFIMLSNGQEYQVDGPVVGLPDMFWVRRSGASGTIMLSQSAAPTPVVIIYDDVHFGQLHWYLTFHDEALGVAVYAEYKFHEDVVEEQLRTINPIYLRNVGYQGLVAVLSKGLTLNSPQQGFPVTSVSMNYDWIYDALFPGSVAESDYGALRDGRIPETGTGIQAH